MSARIGGWMQTASGGQFWPLDPRPEEISIIDIASALSKVCRYGGHCRDFYSVAEHSVYVSMACPPELALAGLLHDASEAYISDIVRPAKVHIAGYREIEDNIMRAVGEAFGVSMSDFHATKDADNAVLLDEQRDIMLPAPAKWDDVGVEPAGIHIRCLAPGDAKRSFLRRFYELAPA